MESHPRNKHGVENVKRYMTRHYLALKGWGLDHLKETRMDGLLLYFRDAESGYLQFVTVLPEIFETEILGEDVFHDLVGTIDMLVCHLSDPKSTLVVDEPKEKLAHLLSAYAVNTKTVQAAREAYGDEFSVYAQRYYDQAINSYVLRPFASPNKAMQTPEDAIKVFEQAIGHDISQYPHRFKLHP